eukprot:11203018-Lingulodinium_polyedra.AAC.1
MRCTYHARPASPMPPAIMQQTTNSPKRGFIQHSPPASTPDYCACINGAPHGKHLDCQQERYHAG